HRRLRRERPPEAALPRPAVGRHAGPERRGLRRRRLPGRRRHRGSPRRMTKFDRLLARLAEPGVVLRLAALVFCAMELVSAGAALLGVRTEPYDGLVAWVWRRMGGDVNDRSLVLICVLVLLAFVALIFRLARQGQNAVPVNRRLAWLLLVDLLAI